MLGMAELWVHLSQIDYRLPGILGLYAGGKFTGKSRRQISDELGIGRRTLDNLLQTLVNMNLVIRPSYQACATSAPLQIGPKCPLRQVENGVQKLGVRQSCASENPQTLGALRGSVITRASELYNSSYSLNYIHAEKKVIIMIPPTDNESGECEGGSGIPGLDDDDFTLDAPPTCSQATPPNDVPVKAPSSPASASKRMGGGHAMGQSADAAARQPGPFMAIYAQLAEIEAFQRKFDVAAWDKRMEEYQARYDVTAKELEQVAFELKNWATDLRGRVIKSPAGTYSTFVQNYVKRRNADAQRNAGRGPNRYAKNNPVLEEKWHQDYVAKDPLGGIMD